MSEMKFPTIICIWCNKENTSDNHNIRCKEIFKPKKFIPQNEWVRIEKEMPENYQTVIAYDGKRISTAFYNVKHKIWFTWTGYNSMNLDTFSATHWMPLPSPPENKNE